MAKKFNGHRCERRNLTDLVLGTGPTGKKRAKPKAKKRPKNYTTEPAVNRMDMGGPSRQPLRGNEVNYLLDNYLSGGYKTHQYVPNQKHPLHFRLRPEVAYPVQFQGAEAMAPSSTAVVMPGMPQQVLNQNMIPDVTVRQPTKEQEQAVKEYQRQQLAAEMAEFRQRMESGEESLEEDTLELFPVLSTILGADDAMRAVQDLRESGFIDNPAVYDDLADIVAAAPVGGWFGKGAKVGLARKLYSGNGLVDAGDVAKAGRYMHNTVKGIGFGLDRTEDERGINKRYGGTPKMSLGNPTSPSVYVQDPLTNAQLALAARAGQLMNRFSNPYGGTYDERHPAVMSFIDDELLGGRFGDKQDDFQYQYLPAGMEDVPGNYRRLVKNMPMSGVPEGATNVTQEFIGAPWSAGTVSHLASAYDPTFQGSSLHADYINRGFTGDGNYEAEKLKRNTGYQAGDILFGGRRNQASYGKNFAWYRRQANQGNRYGSHSDIIYDVTTDADGNDLYHVMGGNMSDTLFDRTYTADQLREKYTGRLYNNAPYKQAGQEVEENAYSFSMPNVDASRSDQLSVDDLNMMGRDMQLSPFQEKRKLGFFGRVGSALGNLLIPGLSGPVGAAVGRGRKMYYGEPTNPTSAVTPEMQEALLRQEAEAKLAALQADRQLFNNRIVTREEPLHQSGFNPLDREESKRIKLEYHNTALHNSMMKDMQGKTKLSPEARQLLGLGMNQLGNAVEDDNAVVGGLFKGASTVMPFASTLGLPGVLAGAGIGALSAAIKNHQERERPLQDMEDARRARVEVEPERMAQFNEQAYADYAQYGNVNPLLYARYGGPMGAPDYETEGGEMIMASPNDPPQTMGSGKYKQETSNMYRIQGPKHERGGVPTKGAMKPYVDAYGQQHDSPYVFSDAAEMKFDPSDILKMLG